MLINFFFETIRSDVEIELPRQHVDPHKCNIFGSKKRANSAKLINVEFYLAKWIIYYIYVFLKSCQITAKIIFDSSSELPTSKIQISSNPVEKLFFRACLWVTSFHSFWKFAENLVLTALFVNLFDFPLHILLLPFPMWDATRHDCGC